LNLFIKHWPSILKCGIMWRTFRMEVISTTAYGLEFFTFKSSSHVNIGHPNIGSSSKRLYIHKNAKFFVHSTFFCVLISHVNNKQSCPYNVTFGSPSFSPLMEHYWTIFFHEIENHSSKNWFISKPSTWTGWYSQWIENF
jgi:hypothetical protein